jgi:hypothetical protein
MCYEQKGDVELALESLHLNAHLLAQLPVEVADGSLSS